MIISHQEQSAAGALSLSFSLSLLNFCVRNYISLTLLLAAAAPHSRDVCRFRSLPQASFVMYFIATT